MKLSKIQIEAADKQLKATRKFLEDQASEREQERDEYSKELDKLRDLVKEKQKDISSQDKQNEVNNLIYSSLNYLLFSVNCTALVLNLT
jgi:hypothetical protein